MSLEHSPTRDDTRPSKAKKASIRQELQRQSREVIERVFKPLFVTIPTACALTGIGRSKMFMLIAQGRVKTIKIGSRILVVYASLEALANICHSRDALI